MSEMHGGRDTRDVWSPDEDQSSERGRQRDAAADLVDRSLRAATGKKAAPKSGEFRSERASIDTDPAILQSLMEKLSDRHLDSLIGEALAARPMNKALKALGDVIRVASPDLALEPRKTDAAPKQVRDETPRASLPPRASSIPAHRLRNVAALNKQRQASQPVPQPRPVSKPVAPPKPDKRAVLAQALAHISPAERREVANLVKAYIELGERS